jgi:hypothetical protein
MRLLSVEVDTPDTECQQPPAGTAAHGTIAEVCVAAGGPGGIQALLKARTSVST